MMRSCASDRQKSRRLRRFFSCLALILLLLTPSVRAERQVSFVIPSLWGGRAASAGWEEAWFSGASDAYCHGLAQTSLAMAVSAFRGSEKAPDEAIRRFLDQTGFDHILTANYAAAGHDTLPTALACRSIAVRGASRPLVAVALGNTTGAEWQNTLDVGISGPHQGFQAAARALVRRIRDYCAGRGLNKPVFWLAGFGRGGAVCGLAAEMLLAEGEASSDSLFVYTFAAPAAAESGKSAGLSCVFNLLLASDPLCQLPPESWGLTHPGQTLYLPTSRAGYAYTTQLAQFSAVYRQFSGQTDTQGDRALLPMLRAGMDCLTGQYPTRRQFAENGQALLTGLLTGEKMSAGQSLRATRLYTLLSAAVRSARSGSLPPLPDALTGGLLASRDLMALYLQHDPAVYACWLLLLPDGKELLTALP